jgi:hypothetical protein
MTTQAKKLAMARAQQLAEWTRHCNSAVKPASTLTSKFSPRVYKVRGKRGKPLIGVKGSNTLVKWSFERIQSKF